MVRAPGLEPGLVRGKSPVPYQSGVTRLGVGREGIEPPVSIDGWVTASCAPWRDRPMVAGTGCGASSDADTDFSGDTPEPPGSDAVVKVLSAELDARRVGRPGRIRTLGRRIWRPRRRLGSSLCGTTDIHVAAHDEVRGIESGAGGGTRRFGYQLMPGLPNSASPAHAGLA